MLPEAGAFEIVFLAAVALIVVGPKDLPVLLRRVGQFTAKMRGLAAEFRASFDEMARQSELDELRKEVDALRNGQFGGSTAAQLNSHVDEINGHLSSSYWDASSQADPVQTFIDPHTGETVGEGEEAAALPPPGARTPPLPTKAPKAPRKHATAAKAVARAAMPEPEARPVATRAAKTTAAKPSMKVAAAKPKVAAAKPTVAVAKPAAKALPKVAKAAPPAAPAVKEARKRASKATSDEAVEA